jgi:mRNA interferase RelE/StbE
MNFRVEFSRRAFDFLKTLDTPLRERVTAKLKEFDETPFPRGRRKLKGGVDVYRLRVGKIRILYRVLWSERTIVVFKIAPRETVY